MTLAHSLPRLACRAALSPTPKLRCPAPRSFIHIITKLHRSHHSHVQPPPSQRLSAPGPWHHEASLFTQKLTLHTRLYSSSSNQPNSTLSQSKPPPKDQKPRLTFPRATAALLLLAGISYLLATSQQQALNPDTFTSFTVTAREQVSPTSFILTVAPSDSGVSALLSSLVPGASPAARTGKLFAEVWGRGTTWSVEVKQPMLQVAREYTPLPEVAGVDPENWKTEGKAELRFLIRKMEGGEVSNYLSSLNVGDAVELRGPHYGFDVRKRLGGAERVVFLAGGTGIAPALQVVKAVLEGERLEKGPRVDILWANRQRADCRACPGLGSRTGELEAGTGGPVLEQLAEMQRRYPGRVSVRCTVDEERSFVEMGALAGLVASAAGKGGDGEEVKDCWLHSQEAVAWRPAADVDSENTVLDLGECRCWNGKNLLFVSGPDGFVEHFAGPKRWANGMELQGPVGGVLGKIRARYPDVMKDWLVLKL